MSPPRSSLIARARLVRAATATMRAEYPVLILFAAVGMGMMVSAGDLLTLYVGLELQSLVGLCARHLPCAATSARPRPASNISCSARSPAASCCTASPCSTASPASTLFGGIARGAWPRRHLDRRAVRARLRARRPRLQDQRGAVPHVDARRLRRRADAGHRLLRHRAQGRGDGAARSASRSRRSGRRRFEWQQIVIFVALASIVLGARRARSARPTSSGCSPIARSTMSASP